MARPKNPDRPTNQFSAKVTNAQRASLEEIERTFGPTPSAVATLMLQLVADVGPAHYGAFMAELRTLHHRFSNGRKH